MAFFSWLRHRTKTQTARGVAQRRPAAPRFRLQVEALEDRCVPSTLTVTSNLDNGAGSLRAEIAAAKSGDTIVFASSLKGQTIALSSGELLIGKGLTIQGLGASQLTLSGGNSSRIFEVAAGVQATLSGLTLLGGDGIAIPGPYTTYDGDGGAILNWGTLTVNSCTISGNTASGSGGGIRSSGTLTVSSSTISGNTAYRGGGIYNNGSASLSGSTVSGNVATGGYLGGIGWVSQIQMDWMEGGGGGIWNAGTMTISGSTLSANHAGGPLGGGGLYNSGILTLSSSTVSGNSADLYGGGIYNDEGASLTLKQGIVSQNTAFQGADLYNNGGYVISTSKKNG